MAEQCLRFDLVTTGIRRLSGGDYHRIDLVGERRPHRQHGPTPVFPFLIGQRNNPRLALIKDGLPIPASLLDRLHSHLFGYLRQNCFQLAADISR